MLNVELPHGLKGASLIQHSTLNIDKALNIQHSIKPLERQVAVRIIVTWH